MNKTYIDPPFGWKYGFPKYYETPPDDINKWLVDNGYPQSEIDIWKGKEVPCYMWYEEGS
jgi:hypothetical protein